MAADGGDFEDTLADMKAKDIWGRFFVLKMMNAALN